MRSVSDNRQPLRKGKSYELGGIKSQILALDEGEESKSEQDYNHIKEYISSIDESMKVEYQVK